jgi:hypothetical protein
MAKQTSVKNIKDNNFFLRTPAGKKWQVIGKKSKVVVCQSEGGSTRFRKLSTPIYSPKK